MTRLETQVVIVGSGPAGSALAAALAEKGRQVALLERGRWHEWAVGRVASLGMITRTLRSRQGGAMACGVTAGGSSVVFNGNAYDPPAWLADELGIDLRALAAQIRSDLKIRPLPESFYQGWPATRRLVQAAADLDIALQPQSKFINPDLCDPHCDDCMLGCRRGAKWTARDLIRRAEQRGAKFIGDARVERVLIENGKAVGVAVNGSGEAREIRAEKVVLAAGGMGTPIILMRSGIAGAGEGFFIDPMNVVLGVGKERGTWREMTFAYASEETVEAEGYLVGTVGAFMVWGAQLMGRNKGRALLRAPYLPRVLGMFTKVGDSAGGRIFEDGTIDKPYTEEDRRKFEKGTEACKKILVRAGADPESLLVARDIGGHPGGTAAIGRVVDRNLECYGAKNLFVCDASVFPRSPGRPPTLTLIALGNWLAQSI